MREVIIISNSLAMGGAEIQAIRNALAFRELGFEVILVTPYPNRNDFFYSMAIQKGLNVKSLVSSVREEKGSALRRVVRFFKLVFSLLLLTFKVRPILIYARSWFPGLIALPLLLFGNLVIYNEESSLGSDRKNKRKYIRKFLLKRYKYWIAPCEGLLKEIRDEVHIKTGQVIPNIILDVPKTLSKNENSIPRVGFIGRFSKEKRIDRVICLADIMHDFEFVLMGSGSELSSERLGFLPSNITLLPPSDDVKKFYQIIDVLLLVSDYEGFSNVIIEANSFGVPVVSLDIPHGPADLIQPGCNGEIVQKFDRHEFATTLRHAHQKYKTLESRKYIQSTANFYTVKNQARRWGEYLLWIK